jgi:MSHA biogenesis protein MshJ
VNFWRRYAERIDAMTLRERVIIFAAVSALLVAAFYSLSIDSEFIKSKRLTGDIAQRQAEMKSIQEQIAKMAQARNADPDRANRERLAQVKAQLAELNAKIAAEERKFTAPDKMRAVLEELLAKNQRVRLVALKTLQPTSIAEARAPVGSPAAAAGKPPAGAERLIFRHGVELVVSGAYLDVLGYLSDLERLPTQLYWSTLGMESKYPVITVKLTVYTLSLDRAWLSV